jgi:hypothetical protein
VTTRSTSIRDILRSGRHDLAVAAERWIIPLFSNDSLRASPREIVLSALPETPADRAALAAARGRVAVVIPASACLRRLVTLPRAARGRADQAIALHMKAKLPSAANGLVWTSRLVESQGEQIVYECHIVKDAHVRDLLAWARQAGVRISEIRIRGSETTRLWDDSPQRGVAARNWAGATFLGVAVIAAGTVAVLQARVQEMEAIVQTKTREVEALTRRLEEVRAEGSAAEQRSLRIAALTEEFFNGARPLSQLADIGRILPEDVWLSGASFAGTSWHLSGFARNEVTETVQALQTLPWAENVRLDGPSSYDSFTDQNRFEIAIGVRSDAMTQ